MGHLLSMEQNTIRNIMSDGQALANAGFHTAPHIQKRLDHQSLQTGISSIAAGIIPPAHSMLLDAHYRNLLLCSFC